MGIAEEFVEGKRDELLAYLDGRAPNSEFPLEPMDFVDSVLDDWHTLFQLEPSVEAALVERGVVQNPLIKNLPEPTRKERTFWYALYQFENLTESPGLDDSSFGKLLLQNMKLVREKLRRREDLPPQFFATRPGEPVYGPDGTALDDEDFEDWIEMEDQSEFGDSSTGN